MFLRKNMSCKFPKRFTFTFRLQAKRAAKLIAAAHRMAKEASRASKRRKVTQPQLPKRGSGGNLLMGARISVYWSEDKTFYKVRLLLPLRFHCTKHVVTQRLCE